jgi:hypothetical protein
MPVFDNPTFAPASFAEAEQPLSDDSTIEGSVEAPLDFESEMETGLSKLKEALDLLNQQFGPARNRNEGPEETRLAG